MKKKEKKKEPRYDAVAANKIRKQLKDHINKHGLELVNWACNKVLGAEKDKRKLQEEIRHKEAELQALKQKA